MKNAPLMTQYDGREPVPKWDSRIARRGALDTLHAEVWLIYSQAYKNESITERTSILARIGGIICDCRQSDTKNENRICPEDIFWLNEMTERYAALAADPVSMYKLDLTASQINLLRTHIRQAELLYCYNGVDGLDAEIQAVLNDLSAAAYVAVRTENT